MIQQIGENIKITFEHFSPKEYDLFLRAKRLPESHLSYDYERDRYTIETHARYAPLLGVTAAADLNHELPLSDFLFEHQREITKLALKAKRFAVWADCGLGKTLIELEFARQVAHVTGGHVLIFTLNEIVPQTLEECALFYGESLKIRRLHSRDEMREWCRRGDSVHQIAITNYEKMNPDESGQSVSEMKNLAGIVLDESSRLKAGGGKQKWALIKSAKGIPYKLSATATPAPNDYIEFASQASFLERMRDESEIIWTFFARDKQTQEWTVKRHARQAFFEWMASWSIYLKLPQSFGWSSDLKLPPDPVVIEHEIPATERQIEKASLFNLNRRNQASLFITESQGIVGRLKLSQIAKGFIYLDGKKKIERIDSRKPDFVAGLIQKEAESHQVLVWTLFDEESEILSEKLIERGYTNFATLSGKDKSARRLEVLNNFRLGKIPALISKAQLLGYGMNFQNCGSMIFSGWNDSFEAFYQSVRRAVRYGQEKAVRIHLPFIRELEYEQLETVFRKQAQFETAILEQEKAYIKAMRGLEIL